MTQRNITMPKSKTSSESDHYLEGIMKKVPRRARKAQVTQTNPHQGVDYSNEDMEAAMDYDRYHELEGDR
jgi:hypothetical protein